MPIELSLEGKWSPMACAVCRPIRTISKETVSTMFPQYQIPMHINPQNCSYTLIKIGNKIYKRVVDDEEITKLFVGPATCHDCGVVLGNTHHIYCEIEICPKCDKQFLYCGCRNGNETYFMDHDDKEGRKLPIYGSYDEQFIRCRYGPWSWNTEQESYCSFCKRLSKFEVITTIEIQSYRLTWLKGELSAYKEICQEEALYAENGEERTLYKDDIKSVGDILGMVNEVSNANPESEVVKIPINDDQREWLKDHFSRKLEHWKKILQSDKKLKSPMIQIIDLEGDIDMIKSFLKTIDLQLEYMCKDCMSKSKDWKCSRCKERKRPKVRSLSSKEKDEFK